VRETQDYGHYSAKLQTTKQILTTSKDSIEYLYTVAFLPFKSELQLKKVNIDDYHH